MKKKLLFLSCLLLNYTFAQEESPFDNVSSDDEQIPIEAPISIQNQQNDCTLSPETIIGLLAAAQNKGDILRLLQEDFYRKTNPINDRSLLDDPALQKYYLFPARNCTWFLDYDFFWNKTPKGIFTDNCSTAGSYAFLGDSPLANEIQTILEDINELGLLQQPINLNVAQILSLFKDITIQERRLGLMFNAAYHKPNFILQLRAPFLYKEHNFFLNDAQIDRIKNDPFFQAEEANEDQTAKQFFTRHLVNDRIGLGDTRVVGMWNVYERPCFSTWLGFEATIPTAFDLSTGILGSEFNSHAATPCFKLQDVVNLFNCNKSAIANDLLFNFGISALDRLSTMLLNIPLGNKRHFGLGPHLEFKHYFGNCFKIHSEFAFEYYFPKTERRFFLIGKNPLDFNRDLFDENNAARDLEFINQQIVNTFFPRGDCVKVFPGINFKLKQALIFENKIINVGLGYDIWYQAREQIDFIDYPCYPIEHNTIDIATKPSAFQAKFFSHIGHFSTCALCDWHIFFTNSVTFAQRGIGGDYTIALSFGVNL